MNRETERAKEAIALELWRRSYRERDDDALAQRVIVESLDAAHGARTTDAEHKAYSSDLLNLLFLTKWLHCGRVQLVVPQKYAAALMSSAVTENMAEDLILPWKAFAVDLPPGLMTNAGISWERIAVGLYEGLQFGCCLGLWGTRTPGANEEHDDVQYLRVAPDPAELFFGAEGEPPAGDVIRDRDAKERALRLAIRLVTGLLFTMQHTNNFRAKTYGGPSGRTSREGPPPHRVYFVGRPIDTDCRPNVARYLGGTGSAPSVQTLVRGHYKRQVVGVGRAGRRVVWIEPYWRGPEDAPILARPYRVGAA